MEENTILVNFVFENNTNAEVEVEPNAVVGDIIEQLTEQHIAPALDATRKHWVIAFKESGKQLDLDKTLAENGVTNGTALRAVQQGHA